jgi:tellurite resistance protein
VIIYGTRGVTYTKESGTFHCPECGGESDYCRKRVRRFFTLYFIPVIPLDLHGEYVECRGCRGTYRCEVLDRDPAKEGAVAAEFHRAIKQVMVDMLLADGVVDDDEVAVVRKVYEKLAGTPLSEADVRAEIARSQAEQRDCIEGIEDMVHLLNDKGKTLVVQAAMLIAKADGEFHEDEKRLVVEIGQALEMPSSRLKAVIRKMLE